MQSTIDFYTLSLSEMTEEKSAYWAYKESTWYQKIYFELSPFGCRCQKF